MSSSITTVATAAEPARRTRRTYSQQQKTDYVARFAASGMTPPAFCREVGLSESTFSYWLRRQHRQQARGEVASFAQVQVRSEPAPASVAVSLQWPTGLRLEMGAADAATWRGLGLLLKTLQS